MINAFATVTGETPQYLAAFYGDNAIDIINLRSIQNNQDRLKQFKDVFVTKVISFFCLSEPGYQIGDN